MQFQVVTPRDRAFTITYSVATERLNPGQRAVDGFETIIGVLAGTCTTLCNVPQVWKSWRTGGTEDLSSKMLLLLASGLVLWVVYGTIKADVVIVGANAVGLGLVIILLYFKRRDNRTKEEKLGSSQCPLVRFLVTRFAVTSAHA